LLEKSPATLRPGPGEDSEESEGSRGQRVPLRPRRPGGLIDGDGPDSLHEARRCPLSRCIGQSFAGRCIVQSVAGTSTESSDIRAPRPAAPAKAPLAPFCLFVCGSRPGPRRTAPAEGCNPIVPVRIPAHGSSLEPAVPPRHHPASRRTVVWRYRGLHWRPVPAHHSGRRQKRGGIRSRRARSRCSGAGPVPEWWDIPPAAPTLAPHIAGMITCRPRRMWWGGPWPRGYRQAQSRGPEQPPCSHFGSSCVQNGVSRPAASVSVHSHVRPGSRLG
jgi:hypothetical protein